MTVAAEAEAPAAGAGGLQLDEGFGWRRLCHGAVTLWLSGHLDNRTEADLAAALTGPPGHVPDLAVVLGATRGHFALAAEGPGWRAAAVDRVRSSPMFFAETEGGIHVAARPRRLLERMAVRETDADGALAMAMAGYTIGTDTLVRGLHQLGPGEAVLVRAGGGAERIRYHRYEPWRVEATDAATLRRRLAEVTLAILERVARQAAGRTIAIPLSAGYDSRAVASGLRHLGVRNVVCFAYGLPGNHEAAASRAAAEKLGYAWRFFPYRRRAMRDWLTGADHAAYVDYADSACSVPFEQDLPAVAAFRADGFIPPDAVLVNGNSGDYISGNHIAPALRRPRTDLTAEQRYALVLVAIIGKHFRLWDALATPANDTRLRGRLDHEAQPFAAAADNPETAHGLYEYLEFQDRQSKYVISGQRIYEYLGHDWRLPLWDDDYLDFWQTVPLALKADQRLYRETLETANWGGIWEAPLWPSRRWVSPGWMRYGVRPALKALHAPLGRARWRRFERRWLNHWMDTIGASSVVSYAEAVRDRRGPRHGVAWLTEAHLARYGLTFDGHPAIPANG